MDPRYIYKPEEYNRQMNEVVSSRFKRNERAKRAHSLYMYIYPMYSFNPGPQCRSLLLTIITHNQAISATNVPFIVHVCIIL